MRNVFDQYTQPENRLTHALAVCLDEDPNLLRRFLRLAGVTPPGHLRGISIVEQSLPGDVPLPEPDADQKGLPDIVLHDDESWCVLIESKVQATLTHDQLQRHERTLRRRGFIKIGRLAITKAGVRAPKGTTLITWPGLYEWLGKSPQRGEWATRLRAYLDVAEVRLSQEGYLTEGTLTMFDGFPFSNKNPYSYGEAKRLLKLSLAELRKSRTLRQLGMDADAAGRPAITGRSGRVVWDFLPLRDRPRRGAFTAYPHLTLALHEDHLEVAITVPNGVKGSVRARLGELGPERITEINAAILRRAKRLVARGAEIRAFVLQRHYVSQRSPAVTDAILNFRLETSLPRQSGRVKPQPEWVRLFAEMPRRRRSNLQFQYRVQIPWGAKGLNSRESLDLIVEGWNSMKPLLDALRGTR